MDKRPDAASERFSAALAGLFAPTPDASEAPPDAEGTGDDLRADEPAGDSRVEPRTILEALLFVGNPAREPLAAETAAALMQGVTAREIDGMVAELNAQYEADGCPYEIVARGPGYLMVLRAEFDAVRRQIDGRLRQARLSTAAVECLSLVAYNQPITVDEVSRLRGSPAGSILAQLVRRRLLRIDRAAGGGRTTYRTSERFLELLGLDSLDDLPQQEELEPS